jgi:DNA ligase (NAD+)
MSEQQIRDLTDRLQQARDAYYRLNAPVMPDAEYDALEKQLRGLASAEPQHAAIAAPILERVGSDLQGKRVRHSRPMLSIENKYVESELIDWHAALPYGTAVCLEPKFDGISVSLVYRNGKLVRALTRGTGTEGEDITPQAHAVRSIPKECPLDIEVRGELVMQNSTLERINRLGAAAGTKQYTSTRNLTGGTMKLKDTSIIPDRDILIMPWDVLGDDATLPDSGVERLALIAKFGFPQPRSTVVSDGVAVGATLSQKLAERETILRGQLSLETDGVVIKVDSHKLRQKLGHGNKFTNWQVCFKPQSASGTTYLRSIEWQLGRTGKVSPVAKCDPVVLAGANVTSASLNNITYIKKMGLKIGAKVEMLRSGDVIPQIVRVLDEGDQEIAPPANCPECMHALMESDEGGEGIIQHFCVNVNCLGQARQILEFIGSRDVLEIDGLGPEAARRLVDGMFARNIVELFQFHTEASAAMARMGEKTFVADMRKQGFDANIVKMLKSLERAKSAPWERWVKAFCIPMVGETLGKAIAAKLDLQPGDMAHFVDKVEAFTKMEVEGFGEAKMKALSDWVKLMSVLGNWCPALAKEGVRPAAIEKPKVAAGAPLAGTVFCITGEIEEDRKSLYKKLESLGAVGKTGVSSKVNLLIVLPGAGKSKLSKATELGIKQVGQEWLVQAFKDNGIGAEAGFAEAV